MVKNEANLKRVYTDSKDNTSSDSEPELDQTIHQNDENTGTSQKVDGRNNNNSNSGSSGTNLLSSSSQNEKFLVTRSQRKYTKPNLKSKLKDKLSEESEKISQENEIPTKRKRETIKSLDSKIQNANDFLAQLNKRLEEREQEIKSLKEVISKDRRQDENRSEIKELLAGATGVDSRNKTMTTFHDFPILDDQLSDEYDDLNSQTETEQMEQEPEIQSRKRGRSRSRNRSKERSARKRSRKSRSRSRSRSKSRGRKFDSNEAAYQNNPDVQALVKKLVQEQVKQEMEKRTKLDKVSGMEKSPSDTLLYTPAVARKNDRWRLDGTPSFNHELNSSQIVDSTYKSQNLISAESIDNTLSKLHLIADGRGKEDDDQPRASTSQQASQAMPDQQNQQREQMRDAKKIAESAILHAERFRARIHQPNRGKEIKEINFNNPPVSPISNCQQDELRAMRYLENDDDEFFHTTCHIDEAIRKRLKGVNLLN